MSVANHFVELDSAVAVATGVDQVEHHREAMALRQPRAWAPEPPTPARRLPVTPTTATLQIPETLKPADGRFGCGPSKVRPEQVAHLVDSATTIMGTSHRQKPVKAVVGRVRDGLRELFSVPDGYEVALGNGGTTAFWDALAFGMVRRRALHLVYGEFSGKFAKVTQRAPFLDDSLIVEAEAGDAPEPRADTDCDVVAW